MTDRRYQPRDPAFAERVRDSFARQGLMATFGAELARVAPGEVEIGLVFDARLTQQHGFLHGGAVGAVLDSACGYSALTLMDAESAVLSVEYKINFLAPARGSRFRFLGRVVKPGRTLLLSEGQALAMDERGTEKLIAAMTCTLMAVRDRGISG